jgi:hypothetical protein
MSRFDQRAEGAAKGRRDDAGVPRAEVRALRNALGTNHRKLEDDVESLEVLLSSNPSNPNAPVEQGPPQPGSREFNLAIEFFGRIAADIRTVRRAVAQIDIAQRDKQKLLAGLNELAKAWDQRAIAFGNPDPTAMEAQFTKAQELEGRAAPARRLLDRYFPGAAEEAES